MLLLFAMEEVDSIILETLKALNCDLPEDISSLKEFDVGSVISCVSTCLEAIIPSSKFPKKLSPSMAIRLKTASYLSEQIKDIGYRDEIGYQTILYFNETEIRKLFIFLIEKLPKESGSFTQTAEVGYIPKLLMNMRKKLKTSSFWIPPSLHNRGTYVNDDNLEIRSYGNSCSLDSIKVLIPSSEHQFSEGFKDYHVNILPTVTKQCSSQQLIPSLLFEDCKFSEKNRNMLSYLNPITQKERSTVISSTEENIIQDIHFKADTENIAGNVIAINEIRNSGDNHIDSLMEDLEVKQREQDELQKLIANERGILSMLKEEKEHEEKQTEDLRYNLKIKKMTRAIVNDEEKVEKLKELVISKTKSKLMKMHQQWNQMKESLVQRHDYLQISLSEKQSKLQEKEVRLKQIMATYDDMVVDLKNKIDYEKKLVETHKNSPQNVNRSMYTDNIIEIIGNIKKQNYEIQKILKDTKLVQKDINTLTGQIDRSFTISDEMIFLHAKEDETSKKAYKLLVSLHNECGEIVKVVSDIGFVERECRNIQEQLDIEGAKQISVKLQRVTEDLQKVKEENKNLQKQVQ